MADDVRNRVAKRIASEKTPLATSALRRRALLVAGLAQASAKSLGRTVRRTVGRDAPDIEPEAELVASLGRLKGTVTKMGQLLGYVDIGLPDTLRTALSALHTSAQPLEARRIREVLEEELGDRGRELASAMDPDALSAGSIGQVHRSSLSDGTPVAVKVLYPGLSTIIERDFGPAMFASRVSSSVHAVIGQVRTRLLEECDYALEARRQKRFAEIFATHDTVVVPEVHSAYCSTRVLTSTFVDGVHLDEWLEHAPSQDAKNRAGEALFDAYIAPLFRHGLYNCDPHPGNYLFMPDGRVAIVDFGCAREFERDFVGRLASLTRAVMVSDGDLIHRALVGLGLDEHVDYDRQATRTLLRAFFGPLVRDEILAFDLRAEIELRELLASGWKLRRIAGSGELFFLVRTFLGLSSVLARIGARSRWRRRLEGVVAAAVVAPPPAKGAVLPPAAEPRGDVEAPAITTPGARPPVPRPVKAAPLPVTKQATSAFAEQPTSEAPRTAPPVPRPSKKPEEEVTLGPARPASSAPAAVRTPETQAKREIDPVANRATVEVAWDVVLVDPGTSQIALIRELREVVGGDLRELKDIIDSAPRALARALPLAEAEDLKKRLERVGARVEVRCTSLPA